MTASDPVAAFFPQRMCAPFRGIAERRVVRSRRSAQMPYVPNTALSGRMRRNYPQMIMERKAKAAI
jgi:hypothetical protein